MLSLWHDYDELRPFAHRQGLKLLPARKILAQLPQQLAILQLPPLETSRLGQLPPGASAGAAALPGTVSQQPQLGAGQYGQQQAQLPPAYVAPQQAYPPMPPQQQYPQQYPPPPQEHKQVAFRPTVPPPAQGGGQNSQSQQAR